MNNKFKYMKYYICSFVLILFSTPLALKTIDIIFYNKNLTGMFDILLKGTVTGYLLIGIMIYILGLAKFLIDNKHK